MKNKFLLVTFVMVFSQLVFAQNEANIWYFGGNAGLDFNTKAPSAIVDGKLNSWEGAASMCNSSGRLLFYTDGVTIWDSTHNVMPNGIGLKGNQSSTQVALIVPKPFSPNIYYLFISQECTEAKKSTGGFFYSEVDMNLNFGKGDVVAKSKNTLITSQVSEKLCSVKHSNGKDYWIVIYKINSDTMFAYRITEFGIDFKPVISKTGVKITANSQYGGTIGQMKISPNGKKIGVSNFSDSTVANLVGDFNAFNGKVNNLIPFKCKFSYGLEFSPDSRYFYITELYTKKLIQFDATATSQLRLIGSKKNITTNFQNAVGSLQLGPDRKIYLTEEVSNSLHVIHAPNMQGNSCRFESNYINLNGKVSLSGLPNFVSSYFKAPTSSEKDVMSGVLISPNPNNGQFTIYIRSPKEERLLVIYNLIGQIIYKETFTSGFLDVNLSIANGIYLADVSYGANHSVFKVFINKY